MSENTDAGAGTRGCVDCAVPALEHCHGTLVVHVHGFVECTEPGCAGERGAHELVVSCEVEGLSCC